MNLKPKGIVSISDADALDASRVAGLGISPIQYIIARIAILVHALATWRIIYLTPPSLANGKIAPAVLVEQIIDGESQFYIYNDSGFPAKNRLENLEDGNDFLFSDIPEGDLNPQALRFVNNLQNTDDTTGKVVDFRLIAEDFIGSLTESPPREGLDNLMGTIAQYAEPNGTNRAMILEIGDTDNAEGGVINLYMGRALTNGQVKVI